MSMIPSYARFQSGGKAVAAPSTRRTVRVFPDAGPSGYNPNNNSVIRLELSPSLGFLDTVNSYLSFRVKPTEGTVNHTKECRMDRNSMSWVQTLTIYSSTGAVLERLENYGLLVNLLHSATTPEDYRSSIQQMIDNSGSRAVRNAAMAHKQGSKFNSGFDASGILGGQTKLLPCSYFQGPMIIELQLAPFRDCFVGTDNSSGTPASYTIDDVSYHAQVLTFGEEYNSKMSQQVRSRGVDLSFDTYKHHETRLIGNSIDTSISQNAASVKGIYHVLRDKDKYRSQEHDSLSTYKSGLLSEIQWDLGSKMYPEFPLKLAADGYTDLYSQNLQSFNMFRNLSLGSEVDDTNFVTCHPPDAQNGVGVAGAFKALPVRRVYGTWVCNGGQQYGVHTQLFSGTTTNPIKFGDGSGSGDYDDANVSAGSVVDEKATVADLVALLNKASTARDLVATIPGSVSPNETTNPITGAEKDLATDENIRFTHTVPTLHFIPNDPRDLSLVQMGMRCQIGVDKVPAYSAPETTTSGVDIKRNTSASGHYTSSYTNLHLTKLGLDRFYRAAGPSVPYTPDDDAVSGKNSKLTDGKDVMYAGAPCSIQWGHTAGSGGGGKIPARQVSGCAIPFVNGQNQPILSINPGIAFEGFVEIMPDDSAFYVACSMESHPEENFSMVSGADLTQMTPLHVRMEFEQPPDDGRFYDAKVDTDPFTTFVHVDSVLRLQPDGTLISSV